jgi:hypothetical protein
MLRHRFRIPMYKDSERMRGERMLAPPVGLQPLPGWARGPLSVPSRPGTPVYKLQVRTTAPTSRLGAAPRLSCVPAAPAPTSRLGVAPGPPQLRLPPPGPGQLRGRRMSPGPQHSPSGSRQLRSCHVSRSTGSTGCKQNKQISYGDPPIMISIRVCARVSSKSLHDKGCSAHS